MADKAIAIRGAAQDLITFDEKKRELIRKTLVSKDVTKDEFELYMSIASARGLDPVLKQIYATKRGGNLVIQAGIDGLRLIASRTGEYAGSDEISYELTKDNKPLTAVATIYRIVAGQRCAFVGKARWDEYFPGEKQGHMWLKMPFNQLGKCAEAQALRKGFPGDLSGLYEPAELERQDGVVSAAREVTPFDGDPHQNAIDETVAKFAKLGVTEIEIRNKFKVDDISDLSEVDLKELKTLGSEIVNKRLTISEAFPTEEQF